MCGYTLFLLLILGGIATIRHLFSDRAGLWLYLPGTLAHEGLHYLTGRLLGANPAGISISPVLVDGHRWILGRVPLRHLTRWNRLPVTLSPLLLYPLVWHMIHWRLACGWHFAKPDFAWAYLLACLLRLAWPSREDRELAFNGTVGIMIPLFGILVAMGF
jgi:hypothetical protein